MNIQPDDVKVLLLLNHRLREQASHSRPLRLEYNVVYDELLEVLVCCPGDNGIFGGAWL